ncbi:nucleotidyltransferase family protein [Dongia rigui]|uniref:Nucleotidyltransferase family protein n=1 Tax=Dongia rigui TaxID=940149 RepID=A0ABU5E233_9PROT|nr:nucleotidyltransferase family protein [Dongia rigui]MDY0873653.1 nucleotidyltransferase family protein [Dongia rigui]
MKNWRQGLLLEGSSIRDAMSVLDRSALQIVLVVDKDERLLGTVTDGDIRRGLLRDLNQATRIVEVMNRTPITAPEGLPRQELIEILRRHDLHHIPIVAANGRVVGLEADTELYEGAERDNWVVLMAGGLGQRLRPLTDDIPKPLLAVGDRPLLEIIIDRFVRQGFRRFFVSVNYRADMVKEHFGDGTRFGCDIRYLEEREPLGTAGAIGLLPEMPTAPFIVMNGDLLTTLDFERLLEFHTKHGADVTLAVRRYSHQIPYGVAEILHNRVTSIVEKPIKECYISGGIYVLSPSVLSKLQPVRQIDMPDLMRDVIAGRGQVSAFPVTEYWIDIGRIEDLERARREFDITY